MLRAHVCRCMTIYWSHIEVGRIFNPISNSGYAETLYTFFFASLVFTCGFKKALRLLRFMRETASFYFHFDTNMVRWKGIVAFYSFSKFIFRIYGNRWALWGGERVLLGHFRVTQKSLFGIGLKFGTVIRPSLAQINAFLLFGYYFIWWWVRRLYSINVYDAMYCKCIKYSTHRRNRCQEVSTNNKSHYFPSDYFASSCGMHS